MQVCNSPLSLRLKIVSGYLLLIMLFGVIVWIVWAEKQKIGTLSTVECAMQEKRKVLNHTFEQLLGFSFADDFLLSGDSTFMSTYHTKRLETTITFSKLKKYYSTYEQQSRIDTVCLLLQEKEEHLGKLMEIVATYDETNELIQQRIPTIVSQVRRENTTTTPTKKKGGVFGLFRKKEQPKTASSPKLKTTAMLYSLSQEVDDKQHEQQRQLEVYTDSLQQRNIQLNEKLSQIIHDFEVDATRKIEQEYERLIRQRERSFRIISLTAIMAILLVIAFYIIIHRDITQKSIYRKKLEDSDHQNKILLNARHKMMLAMSHELRAPLTSIRGYAELIPTERKKENRLRYSDSILQSSGRMLSMLNTLLNFYRLDIGKEQPDVIPFSPHSLTEALETAYSLQALKKRLFFTAEYEGDDLLLAGDRERILQIGGNLLSNAVKYTLTGEVSLHIHYAENQLYMKVSDTGTGMSHEEIQRAFEPFERLRNSDMQEGFGMGLTVTAGLVKLLNGNIWVESEPYKGTTFHVELPMPVANEKLIQEQSATDISLPKHLWVAVVDNDAVLLTMTVDMFTAYNLHCDGCHNAGELMELLRKQPYDLLITDINMPDINGFQLLELLRASNIGNAKEIPVLVATARVERTPEEFIAAGFAGCLYKPYSRRELLTAVRTCIPEEAGEFPIEVDFSKLLSGEHNGKDMLCLLMEETRKDMAKLSEAANKNNRKDISTLIHHLLPLWEMVHTDSVLHELKNVYATTSTTDRQLHDAVANVLSVGERMIKQAGETIKKKGYE